MKHTSINGAILCMCPFHYRTFVGAGFLVIIVTDVKANNTGILYKDYMDTTNINGVPAVPW